MIERSSFSFRVFSLVSNDDFTPARLVLKMENVEVGIGGTRGSHAFPNISEPIARTARRCRVQLHLGSDGVRGKRLRRIVITYLYTLIGEKNITNYLCRIVICET